MCGRYVLVKEISQIIKKFNLSALPEIELYKSYNIAPSQLAPVWSNDDIHQLQLFRFGYIPEWQTKRKLLINARSEGSGKYYNIENSINYTGGFHIKNSREFGQMIKKNRCIVWANCFYEGSKEEGLSKPFVIYKKNTRIFGMAGIWKEWLDKKTGEIQKSFAILTTYPNQFINQHIGHHRIPVILEEEQYSTWLNADTPIQHILPMLHPLPNDALNAYPVSTLVKNVRNNNRALIEPVGQRVMEEEEIDVENKIYKTGFGDSPARRRKK